VQQNKDGVRKLLRQSGLFSLALLFISSTHAAENFKDFKRTQSRAFTYYKDAKDKEFSRYLHSSWQEYSSQKEATLYKKGKPKNIYSATPQKIHGVGPLTNITLPEKKVSKKQIHIARVAKDISFSFFGQYVTLDVDNTIKGAKYYPHNQNGIAYFFDLLAHSKYEDTLREIIKRSDALHLNDWGRYLLVQKTSQEIYAKKDEQKLYTWFMLNKMGYDVKVGLSQKHILLMHYSKKTIYAVPSYIFKKKSYYVVDAHDQKNLPRVYTYLQHYPKATKDLDLSLNVLPNFEENLYTKTLSFQYFGATYPITFKYDKNLIDFMATYPQADYETYFNAAFSEETFIQIAEGIKKYIDGKKASEAINFVLNFVQKSFKYERDQVQFGREKVMFAYETLYYNSSDCEDRATLFAFLVHKLFKIDVIGVKYKDHMATGLNIPLQGDSVKFAQHRFVIADPTYIDANIGQSMPQYKFKSPEHFIVLQSE